MATPDQKREYSENNRHQVEFPPDQTHSKAFEVAMLVISFVCVAVVLIILLATDIGNTVRP